MDDAYEARVARDRVREMVATQGWMDLARWVTEQAQLEQGRIERGVVSWDEYQRSVGRLGAFREVLGRPDELVELANRIDRGDTEHG